MSKRLGIVLVISFISFFLLSVQAYGASPKIVQVSAAWDHSLALADDGSVWEWGSNMQGALTGNSSEKPMGPTRVPISNVVAISSGSFQNLALKDDGTVWAWGHSFESDDGIGNTLNGTTGTFMPVKIPISNVKSIYSGKTWCFAIKSDGTVWAWGNNNNGQLGAGNTTSSSYPVQVLLTNISSISSGDNTDGSIFAVDENGDVWAWGNNIYTTWGDIDFYNFLGDNLTNKTYPVPFKKDELQGVSSVSSGYEHVLVLLKNGSLMVWGGNEKGQFGNGAISSIFSYVNRSTLVNINDIKAISAGFYNSMTLKNDGTVWTWGPKYYGANPSPSQVPGLTDVVAISAGNEHYLALKGDGTVWSWGRTDRGQMGETSNNHEVSTPIQIKIDFSSQPTLIGPDEQNNVIVSQAPTNTISETSSNQTTSTNGTTAPSPGLLDTIEIRVLGVIGLILLAGCVLYLMKRK